MNKVFSGFNLSLGTLPALVLAVLLVPAVTAQPNANSANPPTVIPAAGIEEIAVFGRNTELLGRAEAASEG